MKYIDLNKSVVQKQQAKASLSQQAQSGQNKKRMVIFFAVIMILVGFFFFSGGSLAALFDPVSIVGNAATTKLKETDGRTNILILGSDKRSVGSVTSVLTDTILVASIGRVEGNVVLLSLPRDLWVKTEDGYQSKINAVYANGGGDSISKVAEDVLGVPIHYYAVVNFEIFKKVIDILGGVEVTVDHAFVDYSYPVEGKENAPESERYEIVKFSQGKQQMNGEVALKFVRSRKGDNGEGTDFARSRRQQKVIMAIKDKALSLETLIDPTKLKNLYDTYYKNVDTNLDFSTLQGFYFLSKKINFEQVRSIVLDDRSASVEGGLLYAPEDRTLYGGAYVLIPKSGNFAQLHAYVQRYIFGEL